MKHLSLALFLVLMVSCKREKEMTATAAQTDYLNTVLVVQAQVIDYESNYQQRMISSKPKKIGPITYGSDHEKFSIERERIMIEVLEPQSYKNRKYEILKDPTNLLNLNKGDVIELSGRAFYFDLKGNIPVEFETLASFKKK